MSIRRTVRYRPMLRSEREFQGQIVRAAKLVGWRVYHTFDSRRSEPGFPDLILIRGGQLLAVELKRQKGKPTAEQTAWLAAFAGVTSAHYALWRPSDWSLEAAKKRFELLLLNRHAI